jgi:hypothetical protein
MKHIFLLFFYVFIIGHEAYCQTKDRCDPWQKVIQRNHVPDTLKIKARYASIETNIFKNFGTYYPPGFYGKLSRKYDMPLDLTVQMLDCDQFLSYPFIYRSKYDFTLFPRKNKQGKFVNWKEGQLIEITCVRFNYYYGSSYYRNLSNELIIIIIDIQPLEGQMPIKRKTASTSN